MVVLVLLYLLCVCMCCTGFRLTVCATRGPSSTGSSTAFSSTSGKSMGSSTPASSTSGNPTTVYFANLSEFEALLSFNEFSVGGDLGPGAPNWAPLVCDGSLRRRPPHTVSLLKTHTGNLSLMDKSLDQPEETRELCKEAGIVVQDVADGTTPTATSATDAGNAMHNNKASLMKLLYSILSQKKPKPVPAHPRFLFMLWLG